MIFNKQSPSYILDSFEKARAWIKDNTIDGGIAHGSELQKPYPEVTGYYIPTLLKWGEKERALSYGDWLLSIQTPEGAWQDLELETIYTFDTGQILKGLYELIPFGEKYEGSFLKGCDWLLSQIDSDGRIHTPTMSKITAIGNEYIHLYAIEPLKLAAEKYNRQDYLDGVQRALNYYLAQSDLTEFKVITHFHAYVVEALIDLGEKERALTALRSIQKYQRRSGAIPAFPNVRWVCLTAMLQYAVCFYKLGMLEEGNLCLDYAIKKQRASGGFRGGSGCFVSYFKTSEISWPVKYLLDAIHLKLQLEFAETNRAESFLKAIDNSDGRYKCLANIVRSEKNIPTKNVTLLDIGCGKGRFMHALINDGLNLSMTGMDISDALFDYLPESAQKKVGNICQIPLENETYNIIFCCEVLEHAVNIEAAIKELARVCKAGGTVLIIDKDSKRQKNIRLEAWEQWFDADYVARLMEKSNLTVEVQELITTDGPPICAWIGKKTTHA